ncbi:hypothetical protein DAEQUDRAFT_725135 [Daedalea quercina L-15889]|uniref:Uncharacterized protein n=1 Tax=Daedalea quercina L-15889 TaxID=1314783 RepID=A0A165RD60_9APHY|nr:hypothetical protein DAEQUDRAFT_725135 [Daedalea quercina L-15889]
MLLCSDTFRFILQAKDLFQDKYNEIVQPKLIVTREAYEHPIHVAAIKEWLPRKLKRLFPAVLDEVERALDDDLAAHIVYSCESMMFSCSIVPYAHSPPYPIIGCPVLNYDRAWGLSMRLKSRPSSIMLVLLSSP